MLSRRLRIFLLLAQTIGLFALLYYYLLLRIRPELFYQQKPHVFLFDSHFFHEMVRQPGGVVDYLDAFLSPLLVSDSLGALVMAALVLLICWATRGLLVAVGGRGGQFVYLLPAIGIVMLIGQYIHPVWLCVGLSLVLLAANLYVRLGEWRVSVRVVVFAIGSLAVYFVAAGLYLVFACICACYEWRARRERWVGLAYVLCGAAIPYGLSWWPFDLVFWGAYRGLMLPEGQHWLAIPSTMPLAVAIYSASVVLPLLVVLAFTWRRSSPSDVPMSPEDTSGETGANDGSRRARWLVGLAAPLAMLLLFVLADVAAYDSIKRCLLEIETNSEQQRWDDVLAWSGKFPAPDPRAYDPRTLYCINRALFFKGQLLDSMFAYPQVLSTPSLTLVDPDIDTTSNMTPRQCSEIFFDLGRVNEAEQMTYEVLAKCGNRPEALKRLVQIYAIKGKPEAARRLLWLLERSLLHRGWARQFLSQLESDPALTQISYIAPYREMMVRDDSLGDAGNLEKLLIGLLDSNPRNQMALEYLMAHYLLTRRPDQLAANCHRFESLGATRFPQHVEEALVSYLAMSGQKPEDLGSPSIQPETWRRFADFIELEQASRSDVSVAFHRLYPEFHDTYFFSLVFGHNIYSFGAKTQE